MILGPAWTQAEVAALNKAVSDGLDWDEVACVVPGRTIGACQARLKRQENLKLRAERKIQVRRTAVVPKKSVEGKGRGGNRPWTSQEDDLLMDLLTDGKSGPRDVRDAFPDRSEMAVAYRVGIIWSRQGKEQGQDSLDEDQMAWDADAETSSYDISPCTSPQPVRSSTVQRKIQRGPYAPTSTDYDWTGPTINTPLRPVHDKSSSRSPGESDAVAGKTSDNSTEEEDALVQAQVSVKSIPQLMARLERLEKSTVELWTKISGED